MIRLQGFGFNDSSYERPVPPWICQRAGEGRSCSIGPTADGRCVATFECFPQRSGDRWLCTRNALTGGKCKAGPLPDGKCSHPIMRCLPFPNLRLRRGRIVRYWSLAVVAVLLVLFGSPLGEAVVSPGALNFAHGARAGECKNCHAAAGRGVIGWVKAALGSPADPAQGRLCLDCHRLGDTPLKPHGLPDKTLRSLRAKARSSAAATSPGTGWLAVADDGDAGSVACARCHPDHRGRQGSLVEVSDAQCQACHVRRFDSLASGHPQFENYPFDRRTRIVFDHASHRGKYYPDEQQPFECVECHSPDAAGDTMLAQGFGGPCGACHGAEIRGQSQAGDKGLVLFAVPGLDLESISERHLAVGEWPEDADREVPPLTELLLWGDPEYRRHAPVLRQIDLLDLSEADEFSSEAVEALAWSVKRLYLELARGGQRALRTRLEGIFGDEMGSRELTALSGMLSADTVAMAAVRWFPNLADEVARSQEGNPVPFAPSKPADILPIVAADSGTGATTIAAGGAEDGDSEPPTGAPSAEDTAEAGGWYRDYFALFYRPSGHGDRFLRGWLDFLAELGPEGSPPAAAAVWESLTDPKAPGRCIKCHSIDVDKDRHRTVNWFTKHPLSTDHDFTRFSHASHLSLVGEEGCLGCHAWRDDPEADFLAAYELRDPLGANSNFRFIDKAICVECHQPRLAGQSCLLCHNYHIAGSASR